MITLNILPASSQTTYDNKVENLISSLSRGYLITMENGDQIPVEELPMSYQGSSTFMSVKYFISNQLVELNKNKIVTIKEVKLYYASNLVSRNTGGLKIIEHLIMCSDNLVTDIEVTSPSLANNEFFRRPQKSLGLKLLLEFIEVIK